MEKSCLQWRRLLRNALLMPALPCFMWGPFAHPYINIKALARAKKQVEEGDSSINTELVEACSSNEDAFVFGGNSADAISMHHVINGISIYDYAHNAIPDVVNGIPVFGYALIDQWFKERNKRSQVELAVACGWLGHQIADWYPHYARLEKGSKLSDEPEAIADEIDTFSGYANSHPIFGGHYCPAVLRANTLAEHALIEFFHDLRILDQERDGLFADPDKGLIMFGHSKNNLLTITSERFKGMHVRIPHQHLEYLEKDFDKMIFYMRVLIESIVKSNRDMPARVAPFCKDEFLEMSIDRVTDHIFRVDLEAIQRYGNADLANNTYGDLKNGYVKRLTKPGSVLFKMLHEVGDRLDTDFSRQRVLQLVNDPFLLPPVYFRFPLKMLFKRYRKQLRCYFNKVAKGATVEQNAVLKFIMALLCDSSDPIRDALRGFKQAQRPIISLVNDDAEITIEVMQAMFEQGEIKVRLSPAYDYTDDLAERRKKGLDMNTLLFRIDGYDVTKRPDLFQINEPVWSNCGELILTVGLKETFTGSYHHIFVDIHDYAGMHAKNLDYEVHLGTPIVDYDTYQRMLENVS